MERTSQGSPLDMKSSDPWHQG